MAIKFQPDVRVYNLSDPGFNKAKIVLGSQSRRRLANPERGPGCVQHMTVYASQRRKSMVGARSQLVSDQNRRGAYNRGELRRTLLRSYINCDATVRNLSARVSGLSGVRRFGFTVMLSHRLRRVADARHGCVSRVRNRCVLSGHNRSLQKWGLSRIAFRTLAGRGLVPGLRKI